MEIKNPHAIPHNLSPEQTQILIQLYIAEYQTLTTRCTYIITLQTGIWPLAFIYLAMVAQVWNSLPHGILLWGSILVSQGLVLLWCQLAADLYNTIFYIEKNLRPLIKPLVKNASFWGWERYLARQRGLLGAWWDYVFTFLPLILIIGVLCVRIPFKQWDYFALIINLLLFGFLIWKTIAAVRLRFAFSKDWLLREDRVELS